MAYLFPILSVISNSDIESVTKILSVGASTGFGGFGWLDYVNHHSPEWQEEFTAFCQERNLTINEESAEQFVEWKGDQLENSQED